MERFRGFDDFIESYFESRSTFGHTEVIAIAGYRVAILTLNTAWLCGSDDDKANGLLLGERQVRSALAQVPSDVDMRIAVLHHPFDWLREFDQNDSASLLLDGCDFVLHGHLHRTATTQLISPDGAAMVIAAGACYETRQFPNSYNIVSVDLDDHTGEVFIRRYSDERGGFWAKDTLTYRSVPDGIYRFPLSTLLSKGSMGTRATERRTTKGTPAMPQPASTTVRSDLAAPNSVTVRNLIMGALSDEDISSLCYDHFRAVYEQFSSGMSRQQKVQRLLEHCERHLEIPNLLRLVQEINPTQYSTAIPHRLM
jgi:hypothetical protein